MSKKKNKKGKKKSSYYGYSSKPKKNNKKKVRYDAPILKSVKPTLDKKDAKESRKILEAPIEVPKDFTKNRSKCNHAGPKITPEEFRRMTPAYAAYTPALDGLCGKYGDSVQVCACCYDAVVDTSSVATRSAVLDLYAACNAAVSNVRLKPDEIKAVAKMKEGLSNFELVISALAKYEDAKEAKAEAVNSGSGLNQQNNVSFTM